MPIIHGDPLSHVFSFLPFDERSHQAVNRNWNSLSARCYQIQLKRIQDALIKHGYLGEQDRENFEAANVKDQYKAYFLSLEKIAEKASTLAMIKSLCDPNRVRAKASWGHLTVTQFVKSELEKENIPHAEKIAILIELATDSKKPEKFPKLCAECLGKKRFDLALLCAEKIDEPPLREQYFLMIAIEYIKKGEIPKALSILKKVNKPNSDYDLGEAACLLEKKGFFKEALEQLDKRKAVLGIYYKIIADRNLENGDLLRALEAINHSPHVKVQTLIAAQVVRGLFLQQKFDEVVQMLKDHSCITADGKINISEHTYVMENGKRVARLEWSEWRTIFWDIVNVDLASLPKEDMLNLLQKIPHPGLRDYLCDKLAETLRDRDKPTALQVANLIQDKELKKKQIFYLTGKFPEEPQEIEIPVRPKTKREEKSSVQKQATAPIKKPERESSVQPSEKIQSKDSSSTPDTCFGRGSSYVARLWNHSWIFKIFSVLTLGLLPLLTFFIGSYVKPKTML